MQVLHRNLAITASVSFITIVCNQIGDNTALISSPVPSNLGCSNHAGKCTDPILNITHQHNLYLEVCVLLMQVLRRNLAITASMSSIAVVCNQIGDDNALISSPTLSNLGCSNRAGKYADPVMNITHQHHFVLEVVGTNATSTA
jgi:hypothetical protein